MAEPMFAWVVRVSDEHVDSFTSRPTFTRKTRRVFFDLDEVSDYLRECAKIIKYTNKPPVFKSNIIERWIEEKVPRKIGFHAHRGTYHFEIILQWEEVVLTYVPVSEV